MAAAATRMAGKALGDFFKVLGPLASSAVEQAVLNKLVGKYTPKEVAVYPPRADSKTMEKEGYPSYSLIEDNPAVNTRIGKIVTKLGPENIAKVAGAVTPLAAAGATAGGAALINQAFQQPTNVYAQSQYSLPVQKMGTQVAYANQRYTPGVSPVTNQAVLESMLQQQKFEHQLQLIQARQAAQQGAGSLAGSPGYGQGQIDPYSSLNRILNTTYTY